MNRKNVNTILTAAEPFITTDVYFELVAILTEHLKEQEEEEVI